MMNRYLGNRLLFNEVFLVLLTVFHKVLSDASIV